MADKTADLLIFWAKHDYYQLSSYCMGQMGMCWLEEVDGNVKPTRERTETSS